MKKYCINKEFKNYAPAMACDIAQNVIDLLNSGEYDDLDDTVRDAIDSNLIYYADEWEMLQAYCTPKTCDYYSAYEALTDDVYRLIEEEEDNHPIIARIIITK